MSYVFTLLGLLALVVGIGWAAVAIGGGGPISAASVLLAVPGLSIAGSGLLMLAIGSALHALGRIARNTADSADASA